MTVAIVLGSLLLVVILIAPAAVYELRGETKVDVEKRSSSIVGIALPGADTIPVHIPMMVTVSPVNYSVPYWLGGFAVTTPSPATWTLPLTYAGGGRVQAGEFLQIRNYGPALITLQTTSPETVEGVASYVVPVGAMVKILSNYPNWIVTTPLSTGNDVRYYGAKCDGITDDTTAIQRAISATALIGGVVSFPAGTCMISSLSLINAAKSVILRGIGYNSILQRLPATPQGVANMLSLINSPSCIVESLNFVNYANSSIGTLYLDNAIAVSYSSSVTVQNCYFSIGYSSAVLLVQSPWAMVRNNRVYASGENPSNPTLTNRAVGAIYVVDGSSYAVITGNQILEGQTCIAVQSVAANADIIGVTIANNVVRNCSGYGILVYSLGSWTYDTSVTGNTVEYVWGSKNNSASGRRSFGAGIYIQASDKTSVTGNTIAYTNLMTDEELLAPGAIGTANCAAVTITGNTIREPAWWGIYIASTPSNFNTSGPTIVSNSVAASGVSPGVVKLNNIAYFTFTGNQLQGGNLGYALYILSSSFGVVSGNNLDFAGVGGFNTAGIALQTATRVTVTDNILRATAITGIGIASVSANSYSTIERNFVSGGQRGIQITAGATMKVKGNHCVGQSSPYIFDVAPTFYEQNTGVSGNAIFQGNFAPIRTSTVASNQIVVDGAVSITVDGSAGPTVTSLVATNPTPGQIVYIRNLATATGNITFTYNANSLRLAGSVDLVLTAGSLVGFICLGNVAPVLWQEVTRTMA